MATSEEETPRGTSSYRFGPRDQRGLLAGIRTGQAVVLVASLGLGLLTIRSLQGQSSVPVGLAVAVFGGCAAWVPLRGRSVEQWLPVVTRHLGAIATGKRHYVATVGSPRRPRRCPPPFAGLEVVAVASSGGRPPFGAVEDRRQGILTGVLQLGGSSFSLLDEAERALRVGAWSGVLAALASESREVARVQWIERTLPDGPRAAPAGMAAHPMGDGPERSYSALLRTERGQLRHELLVACSVRTSGQGRRQKGQGQVDRLCDAGSSLSRELANLERRCREAGLAGGGALSVERLRTTLRKSFERHDTQGPAPRSPWPSSLEVAWSSSRTEGLWQVTYWIAEWPRSEVRSDFLLPVLLGGDDRRSLSLVMVPMAPRRAVRAAEHARTSSIADAELRARHGFSLTARTRREHDAVLRRESELAEGHAGYRFSGYLSVAAGDRDQLARSCRRVEQAASLARLELLRLDGAQGEALTFCLPLGRGCR